MNKYESVIIVNPNVDEAGLKALEEKYNCTTSQILLGYILNQDFETLPLAGASKIEQLEDFMKTIHINFNKGDFKF